MTMAATAKPTSITIRIHAKVKARIAAKAKAQGLTPAQWARQQLILLAAA